MKKFAVKAYLAVNNVLENRKGASTVEYVAVLAGAAAIGALLIKNSDKIGGELMEKISKSITGIGG